MTRSSDLSRLFGVSRQWTDDLKLDTEIWLEAHCTRDELISIADRSGQHHLAPNHRPEPVKSVLAFDLVSALSPPQLLVAWRQVKEEKVASASAFDRLSSAARRSKSNP